MNKYLLYLVSLPNDLVVIPLLLLIHKLWGENLRWEGRALCTDLRPGSWPVNKAHSLPFAGWYARWGGTTFGHAIMYGTDRKELTAIHEHVHVHQSEAAMAKSLLMGLLALVMSGNVMLFFGLWSSGYGYYLTSNWLVAKLRGGSAYKDSVHEEHAYAVERAFQECEIVCETQRLEFQAKYGNHY